MIMNRMRANPRPQLNHDHEFPAVIMARRVGLLEPEPSAGRDSKISWSMGVAIRHRTTKRSPANPERGISADHGAAPDRDLAQQR